MILLLAYYTTRMVVPISVHLPSSVSSPMLAKKHLFLFHKRNIIKCMKKDLHGGSSTSVPESTYVLNLHSIFEWFLSNIMLI
jgi:hypothetical protein